MFLCDTANATQSAGQRGAGRQGDATRCNGRGMIGGLLIAAAVLAGLAGIRPAHAGNEVTAWNNEFLLITQQTSGNLVAGPPEVAREIAQIGAAMSDAVNAATGSTISSFAYTGGSMANANAGVAAATAAYTALNAVFTDPVWSNSIASLTGSGTSTSNTRLATNVVIPELQSFLSSRLGALGLTNAATVCGSSVSALCNGYNLGIAAANAVNSALAFSPTASGAAAAITNGLTPHMPAGSGTTPGVYVPPSSNTPPGRPEMFPTWGPTPSSAGVTPAGISSTQLSAAMSTVGGPPAIGSAAYANALLQTQCQGSSAGQGGLAGNVKSACAAAGFARTAAQAKADATAALFWNDPGTTIQPPGHWLQIANSAMQSQNSSLLQSAQLTAILGEAQYDAGIAAWGTKYTYNLWRPTTAIRNCDTTGTGTVTWSSDFTTCDAAWASLIATPPHPDYLAGHPAFSGAAASVLADFFGTDAIGFASTSNYYCNGGITNFNSANLPVSCTRNGTTYYVCSATTTPDFINGMPVDCTDGTSVFAVTGGDCNTVTTTGINNDSPLICPITETYTSFSDASSGLLGSAHSRVAGGIHTPFAAADALALGNQIGALVATSNGLPDLVPEPSSLSLCAVSLLALIRLRGRRAAQVSVAWPPMKLLRAAFGGVALLLGANGATAAEPVADPGALAKALATSLAAACPAAGYGDEVAFQACALALRTMSLPFSPSLAWGGDQPDKQIKRKGLTHFNSRIFQTLYLPLFTFTGRWSLTEDKTSHTPIARIEGYFRNTLPPGDYPYPFWHSADKWAAYEAANEIRFYLDANGQIFIVTRGNAGDEGRRGAYVHAVTPAFDGSWQWQDTAGTSQPHVSLFSARYGADNPFLTALDKAYRSFAPRMRDESCLECHTPANKAEAERLVLLQTPLHAAAEIDNVIKAVTAKKMPQDDIGLPKDIPDARRAAVLIDALAFRDELAPADNWEAKHPH